MRSEVAEEHMMRWGKEVPILKSAHPSFVVGIFKSMEIILFLATIPISIQDQTV